MTTIDEIEILDRIYVYQYLRLIELIDMKATLKSIAYQRDNVTLSRAKLQFARKNVSIK